MTKYALIFFLFVSQMVFAQSQHYSRVKVQLNNDKTIAQLAALGLDAEHGDYKPEVSFTSDFSDKEIQQIANAGFDYEIIIVDVQRYYVEQNDVDFDNTANQRTAGDCSGVGFFDYFIPDNFELGSMGGFFTYEEMLEHLDAMHDQFPNLITEREPVGSILTHEGRPLYWLRISDNPQTDENNEPEVFYNALQHAREPNGLSQLIYYMWYLLERYDTDPEIKYLLDNTELYFLPMVNPDGYIYNQTISPDGGGLWRKNKRDNNTDGVFSEDEDGVDLNRNYGYEWGFNDSGSSPNPSSAVYRGPSAFSEPELQNVRDFCNAHEFEIALNYHTYGNLLIYPWGYSDDLADPIFVIIAEAMNRENKYLAGTSSETVGYQVNGVSDDWMHGEAVSKPPIFSLTPEVGYNIYGFWPPSSEIIRFCQSALLENLTAAHLVLNYGIATDLNPLIIDNIDGSFEYDLKRYGLMDGNLTVSLLAASDNIVATGNPETFALNQGENVNSAISYTLDANINLGEAVYFVLAVDNGVYTHHDTIIKSYGLPQGIFTDDLGTEDNWDNVGAISSWGLRAFDVHSPPSCMSDSPNGTYEPGSENILELVTPVSLLDAETAKLNFWAKWQIERYRDYAQVQVSNDNGQTWEPICGKYTVAGTTQQDFGEPVYQETQDEWVLEEMDLTEFAGTDILLRFIMKANGNGSVGDGFNFDDMSVSIFEEIMVSTQEFDITDFTFSQNHPNPAKDYTVIDLNQSVVGSIHVYNVLGQEVYQKQLGENNDQIVIQTANWTEGLYSYRLNIDGVFTEARKMVVGK